MAIKVKSLEYFQGWNDAVKHLSEQQKVLTINTNTGYKSSSQEYNNRFLGRIIKPDVQHLLSFKITNIE